MILEPQLLRDERGAFARTFCKDELARAGIEFDIVQCNLSINARRGTLRGMHFQRDPKAEAKIVSCTRGKVWDVIVDLRKGSPTYCRWHGVELSDSNRRALYVPKGFAHGFVTLQDASEMSYLMSEFFSADHSAGVRWNDPVLAIDWPIAPTCLSPKDQSYPDFHP